MTNINNARDEASENLGKFEKTSGKFETLKGDENKLEKDFENQSSFNEKKGIDIEVTWNDVILVPGHLFKWSFHKIVI